MTDNKKLAKQLALTGHSYREIGRRLNVTHKTIKRWINDKYRKLDNEAQNIRYRGGQKTDFKSNAYREKHTKYVMDRYKSDIAYRLKHSLRRRLYTAIKGDYKSGSAVADIGCTISELKVYIDSKFLPGMSWENYGRWHIDHKEPLDNFDLTNRTELLAACHYTNLQPLWAKDNLTKSNKVA